MDYIMLALALKRGIAWLSVQSFWFIFIFFCIILGKFPNRWRRSPQTRSSLTERCGQVLIQDLSFSFTWPFPCEPFQTFVCVFLPQLQISIGGLAQLMKQMPSFRKQVSQVRNTWCLALPLGTDVLILAQHNPGFTVHSLKGLNSILRCESVPSPDLKPFHLNSLPIMVTKYSANWTTTLCVWVKVGVWTAWVNRTWVV